MANKIPVLKLLVWLLPVMLIIAVVSLMVVAANDEGMLINALFVELSSILFKFLYFPFWYIESIIMPSSNVFFVVAYLVNTTLWAIIFAFFFRLLKKFL